MQMRKGNNMCVRTDCSIAYIAELLRPLAGAPEIGGFESRQSQNFLPAYNFVYGFVSLNLIGFWPPVDW